MPRILEFRQIDGHIWAKLEIKGDESPFYIHTIEEVNRVRRGAIRNFLYDLGDAFINKEIPFPKEPD